MLQKANTATDPQPRGGCGSNVVLDACFMKHLVPFVNLGKAEIVYYTFCVYPCACVYVCMCLLAQLAGFEHGKVMCVMSVVS